MADVNNLVRSKPLRMLILLGLSLLAALFAWFVYREVLFFGESWRWRHNVLIQVKIGFRIFFLLMLMIGAGVGPVAFMLKSCGLIRSKHEKK